MVQQAPTLFIDSFDAEVHIAYQGIKSLRDKVRKKTGVIGNTHRFPKAGKGVATQHNRGNDVVAMNAGRDKVTATLEDWEAFDYEDKFDVHKSNIDDRKIIAENTVKAIGRREDQLIIDAMEAGANVAMQVDNSSAAMDVDDLIAAAQLLDENNVPEDERYIAVGTKQKAQLLKTTEITNADYATVKALVHGSINSFMGFEFTTIGARDEGGLPVATNVRTAFYWHKSSIGLAIGMELETMVDWIPQKVQYQVGATYSAGAVAIDDEGFGEILTLDTA